MIRICLFAASLSLVLAACAGPPDYPQPTERDALAAYKNGIRADLAVPLPPDPKVGGTAIGDTPGEAYAKTVTTFEYESLRGGREILRRRLPAIRKVRLGECTGARVSLDRVQDYSHHRLADVDRAWECAFTDEVDSARGRVAANGTAYFYRADEKWLMATFRKGRGSYERVR
ncbi:hypothetical protein [Sphingomicrobium arenosum]|uniref:hypothetical protein n=1 Tax=Sphingomicrobium arenosum TaxID=2233861 RepID=UPI002240ED70|nr:hypothetical protein [Sphingomicrobium arenosum]